LNVDSKVHPEIYEDLIGIIGARVDILILYPIAGISLTIFIIKMGWDITSDGVLQLMDGFNNRPIIGGEKKIIDECDGVSESWDIKARQNSPYIFVDIKIGMDKKTTVEISH